MPFTDSRSFFPAGLDECSDPRLAILDLHPTGPQWGEGPSPAGGETAALENTVADDESVLRDWLVRAGMEHERRILRLPIGRLTWHYPESDSIT
ncbi:tRNA pseudouridine synthase D [Pseudomonas amygdali pv. mori str. 301020]|uniref:tRNA pseudouridine synthase D n=1 Tax=Pseudomonas amygdali pv. mori str. 301020 TaxID=629261 RepID=A0A656GIY7_PSEA0|nr:tRNA pseudouridine synthase D [Pseudomonas amygdali pv. mori str. 301020]